MFEAWKLLLIFFSLVGAVGDYNCGPKPGRPKQDYDAMEEVKGHDNDTEAEKPVEDEQLTKEAILDVAYYLRRFKFSGYDPRYLAEGEIPRRNLFVEFPSPPLRNIHWEVKKNCEPSFVECVKYLREQVSQAVLPRRLDSLTITRENGWSFITDRNLIKSADEDCIRLLQRDEATFAPFSGPVQKFQWLVSASYYMCFYAMKEVPYLRNFTEDCDNHGACIQWQYGLNNNDVRAENGCPFACAMYSFCPDPCCPRKHLRDWSACDADTPCVDAFSSDKTCTFSRNENSDFESITLNRWNISCVCDLPGTRWESKAGMCVDIDECIEYRNPCDFPPETCRNLPGAHKCVCSSLGYVRNPMTGSCEMDPVLHRLFHARQPCETRNADSLVRGLSETFWNFFEKVKSVVVAPLYSLAEDSNHTETDRSNGPSIEGRSRSAGIPPWRHSASSVSSFTVPVSKKGKF